MTLTKETNGVKPRAKRVKAIRTPVKKPLDKTSITKDGSPSKNKRPYTSGSAAIYRELNAKVEAANSAIQNTELELIDLKETLERDIAALTAIHQAEVDGRIEYINDLKKVVAMGEAAFEAHKQLEETKQSNVAMAS